MPAASGMHWTMRLQTSSAKSVHFSEGDLFPLLLLQAVSTPTTSHE
jgi:hypothetical protein